MQVSWTDVAFVSFVLTLGVVGSVLAAFPKWGDGFSQDEFLVVWVQHSCYRDLRWDALVSDGGEAGAGADADGSGTSPCDELRGEVCDP